MRILTLNAGSSSLKYAVYEIDEHGERRLFAENLRARNRSDAASMAREATAAALARTTLDGAAHRIVFGGPRHVGPAIVDPALLADLRALAEYDPLHLPAELDAIDAVAAIAPGLAQTLSFDTAFHRTLPAVARALPLPHGTDPMVQRYGFHGLSYEYIVATLGEGARGRTIVAHLGSGASMAALRDGAPVDTTMGFTPLGGLMMGTRPGDLDPGVVLRLLHACDDDARRLSDALFYHSGLLGVSGSTSEMQALTTAMDRETAAAQAVGLFVFIARKSIGALAAALDGVDRLVFTGGIGEHSASVRALICLGLTHLGIALDVSANIRNDERISAHTSHVVVNVIPTNEELMLARHAHRVLSSHSHPISG